MVKLDDKTQTSHPAVQPIVEAIVEPEHLASVAGPRPNLKIDAFPRIIIVGGSPDGSSAWFPTVQSCTQSLVERMGSYEIENPPDFVFRFRLLLEESLVNHREHGHGGKYDKPIAVDVKVTRDGNKLLWVDVLSLDQGNGFDPKLVPDCRDNEHIDIPSGRGVLLLQAYSSVHKTFDGGRGTWLRISAEHTNL